MKSDMSVFPLFSNSAVWFFRLVQMLCFWTEGIIRLTPQNWYPLFPGNCSSLHFFLISDLFIWYYAIFFFITKAAHLPLSGEFDGHL
jgi:hypothetical protein